MHLKNTVHVLLVSISICSSSPINSYFKCCSNNEQLSKNEENCVVHATNRNVRHLTYERVKKQNPKPDWLPEKLFRPGIKIRYAAMPCERSYWDRYSIDMHLEFKVFLNNSLEVTKNNVTKIYSEYCFDVIEGEISPVIRACKAHVAYEDKCCPLGESLNYTNGEIKCEKATEISEFEMNQTSVYVYRDIGHFLCENGSLRMFEEDDEHDEIIFSNKVAMRMPITHLFYEKYLCVDKPVGKYQRKQSKIYCRVSQITRGIYFLSQPLSLVSALCLFLSLCGMSALPELRASMPGRALCCHTFSLFMVNVLRAVWFFSVLSDYPIILQTPDKGTCHSYALVVYFFLVASWLWLNALSIDMADRFRRLPLQGVLGDGGGGYKRFMVFAIYAWGATCILTVRCTLGVVNDEDSDGPTLHETRTCFYESELEEKGNRKKTLEYYYGPMGILFLVNLLMYAYIIIKLHNLYNDTELVENPNEPTPPHRSAGVFVRLLLLLGVIEWAVEMVAWGTRRSFRQGQLLKDYGRLAHPDDELRSEYALRSALNVLDALRAACLLWLCCGRPRVRRKLTESVRESIRTRTWRRASRSRRKRIDAVGGSSAGEVAFSSSAFCFKDDGRVVDAHEGMASPTTKTNLTFSFLRELLWRCLRFYAPTHQSKEESVSSPPQDEEIEMNVFPWNDTQETS